jgi:hypothetical protein
MGLGLGNLLGRHPGLIGPRLGANDRHILNSGLAVRAGCAGRKWVKSPSTNISHLWMGVKQGSVY